MRLLSTSDYSLQEFIGTSPPYAILSHTWGRTEEEVTFQDITDDITNARSKEGFAKIKGSCRQAQDDGFKYIWIDSCCIDKTSSSELSEAINSMYQWYAKAEMCYAYLVDVEPDANYDQFKRSRWFTRGWTLQELLAPQVVEFYAKDWSELGTRSSLKQDLTSITGIPSHILGGGSTSECNVATRISWASKRRTSRAEDMAYCLMGIFDVNMPLLYGEGGTKAFARLQEEILKANEDHSLFTWTGHSDAPTSMSGLLAPSPASFCTCILCWHRLCKETPAGAHTQSPYMSFSPTGDIHPELDEPATRTSKGIKISLLLCRVDDHRPERESWIACLDLVLPNQMRLGIPLGRNFRDLSTFYRVKQKSDLDFLHVGPESLRNYARKTIFVQMFDTTRFKPIAEAVSNEKAQAIFLFSPLPDSFQVSGHGYKYGDQDKWFWYSEERWLNRDVNRSMGILILGHGDHGQHPREILVIIYGFLDSKCLTPFCHMQVIPFYQDGLDLQVHSTTIADKIASQESYTHSDRASLLLNCGQFVTLSIRRYPWSADSVSAWDFYDPEPHLARPTIQGERSSYLLTLELGAPPQDHLLRGMLGRKGTDPESASGYERARLFPDQSTVDGPAPVMYELP